MSLYNSNVKNHFEHPDSEGNNKFIVNGRSQIGEGFTNILSRQIIPLMHPDISITYGKIFFSAPRQYQIRSLMIFSAVQPNADTDIQFLNIDVGIFAALTLKASNPPEWRYIIEYDEFLTKEFANFDINNTLEIVSDGIATNGPIPVNIIMDIDYIYNNPPVY